MASRNFSPRTTQALHLLGSRIEEARRNRRWTVRDFAERLGVSTVTMARILEGQPSVAIGTVFEAATIVGVPLFAEDPGRLALEAARVDDRLAVLPRYTRKPPEFDDDF